MGIETAAYIIGAAAAIGGTAISYSAQQKQAEQADDAAKLQQQQANIDANVANSEAQLQARAIRKAADKQRAEARASLAGAGVVVGEGTAEQIDKQITADSETDALMALYEGQDRASQIRQGGAVSSWRSRNQADAARLGATATALSGAATLASGWNVKKKG